MERKPPATNYTINLHPIETSKSTKMINNTTLLDNCYSATIHKKIAWQTLEFVVVPIRLKNIIA